MRDVNDTYVMTYISRLLAVSRFGGQSWREFATSGRGYLGSGNKDHYAYVYGVVLGNYYVCICIRGPFSLLEVRVSFLIRPSYSLRLAALYPEVQPRHARRHQGGLEAPTRSCSASR